MMNRYVGWCAVLAAVMLFALPETSTAKAVRSGGSSSGRYSSPVYYSSPVFYPSYAAVPAPQDDDYAYGASQETDRNAVLINVRVPANAEVWFDGTKTSRTGGVRSFVTPPLEPGREYSYEIRVRWIEEGRPVERVRKINFRAGERHTLNFMS
jgi:uncharacterized protein (TIGR03000 family)